MKRGKNKDEYLPRDLNKLAKTTKGMIMVLVDKINSLITELNDLRN